MRSSLLALNAITLLHEALCLRRSSGSYDDLPVSGPSAQLICRYSGSPGTGSARTMTRLALVSPGLASRGSSLAPTFAAAAARRTRPAGGGQAPSTVERKPDESHQS